MRLRDNPHLASWIFVTRANAFIKHIRDAWDVDWYWYRFETQQRGSWHVHGCFKLKNEIGKSNFIENSTTALHGFLAQKKLQMIFEQNPDTDASNAKVLSYTYIYLWFE
jgi:hypothetical protein